MSDLTKPEIQSSHSKELSIEYLLKELEFQVSLESSARDRMENMVQYLLTTIAAGIGAALLVNEMQVNSVLLFFIASLLLFVFSTSAFYRACRLRYITTYARVNRNKIRCVLRELKIPEADKLIEWEGNPFGFCGRMMSKLIWLMLLCCLFGGLVSLFAVMLTLRINRFPIDVAGLNLGLLIVIPLILTVVVGVVLGVVLSSQKSKSDDLITDSTWKDLPDYDL